MSIASPIIDHVNENMECCNHDITSLLQVTSTGLILVLRVANDRRRYTVTPSLIGWAQI